MENLAIRPSTVADAERLLRIRYDAIMAVRIPGVAKDQIRRWAEGRDLDWMRRGIRERDTWVGTVAARSVSWIAVSADRIEGLYTDPRDAGQGIGSALLLFAEGVLGGRGVKRINLEAAANSESFYRKRGYEAIDGNSVDGALAMQKAITRLGRHSPQSA